MDARAIPFGEDPPMMGSLPDPSAFSDATAGRPKGSGNRATGERFIVLNNFVDWTMADLSRAEIAVWLILYRDTRDGSAKTSMADLARRAGCSRRSVVTAIAHLKQRGLLRILHKGALNRGSSRYRIRPFAKDG